MEKRPWKWCGSEMVVLETKKGYYNITKFYYIATVLLDSMNILKEY
jgi:hypothetical protein